ncbi:MAG: CoA pyrophosphatase [Blastocatellia bacterium]|jgi:8-oxo-dGTP pyrophosphatase MutT (NUDIX family)|nr:CoA pyrophosphatase [Blastocatellia bacterium]
MPTVEAIRDVLRGRLLDAGTLEPPSKNRMRAAVAILLRDGARGPEILLIKRAEDPRDHWSGHIALPGGRWDDCDGALAATALRETREEVGIELGDDALLGRLARLSPVSRRLPAIDITPFVALAPPDAAVRANHEVAAHFWASVEKLRATGPAAVFQLDLPGEPREFPAYDYDGHIIWGLTERILTGFLSLLDPARER